MSGHNNMLYKYYRPLSRRLDRCDRVIQNESRDPIGGNVYYVRQYTLPPNGSLASLPIAMAFSR